MTPTIHRSITIGALLGSCLFASPLFAQSLNDAITGGKVSGNFRLRFESVEQDNALLDAEALTLRSVLNYATGSYKGFSAVVEMEDVRSVLGKDEYTVGPTGFNPGIYSVVADPESTELNQGYIQYSNAGFTAKLGRQIINLDNQRFVGAVGWRQDWQVFDAFTAGYQVNDAMSLSYSYLDSRERVFAQDADIESSDHLIHADWKSSIGAFTGYAYLLEVDNTPAANGLDTYGIRYSGSHKFGEMPITYMAEYATQESTSGAVKYDADYFMVEGGLTYSGITAKAGYELLGSDNASYGFSTPLATLHAFNGWADTFLATPAEGLEDYYLSLGGKLFGGTLTAVYHEFDADKSTPTVSDMGSEIDIQYVRPITPNYTLGLKFADYQQGDVAARPDTQKIWVWFQAAF